MKKYFLLIFTCIWHATNVCMNDIPERKSFDATRDIHPSIAHAIGLDQTALALWTAQHTGEKTYHNKEYREVRFCSNDEKTIERWRTILQGVTNDATIDILYAGLRFSQPRLAPETFTTICALIQQTQEVIWNEESDYTEEQEIIKKWNAKHQQNPMTEQETKNWLETPVEKISIQLPPTWSDNQRTAKLIQSFKDLQRPELYCPQKRNHKKFKNFKLYAWVFNAILMQTVKKYNEQKMEMFIYLDPESRQCKRYKERLHCFDSYSKQERYKTIEKQYKKHIFTTIQGMHKQLKRLPESTQDFFHFELPSHITNEEFHDIIVNLYDEINEIHSQIHQTGDTPIENDYAHELSMDEKITKYFTTSFKTCGEILESHRQKEAARHPQTLSAYLDQKRNKQNHAMVKTIIQDKVQEITKQDWNDKNRTKALLSSLSEEQENTWSTSKK